MVLDLNSSEFQKLDHRYCGHEMFGEVGPIIEETRTVTVIAETNCTLKEIDDATIHNKLDGADPVLVGIIRGLALRIGDANKLAEKYWQELSVYKSLE